MSRLLRGGSPANEQLTAAVAAVLLPLLAAEGATLLDLRRLLTVHAFIGVLLIPAVALKIVSTGWRMMRYYRRAEDYVLRGPPHMAIRALVAPVLVASTVLVFGTGIALLALDRTQGALVGLHKASFVVWAGAFTLHLLTRALVLLDALRRRMVLQRVVVASLAVGAGLGIAMLTLPAADRLQDNVSGHAGVDTG